MKRQKKVVHGEMTPNGSEECLPLTDEEFDPVIEEFRQSLMAFVESHPRCAALGTVFSDPGVSESLVGYATPAQVLYAGLATLKHAFYTLAERYPDDDVEGWVAELVEATESDFPELFAAIRRGLKIAPARNAKAISLDDFLQEAFKSRE